MGLDSSGYEKEKTTADKITAMCFSLIAFFFFMWLSAFALLILWNNGIGRMFEAVPNISIWQALAIDIIVGYAHPAYQSVSLKDSVRITIYRPLAYMLIGWLLIYLPVV